MHRLPEVPPAILRISLAGLACLLLIACPASRTTTAPSISITHTPPAGEGGPEKLETIEGRVAGILPDQRVVLFALSGVWWVQPFVAQPFTTIEADLSWKSSTHPGTAYAALLVDSMYHPPPSLKALPEPGGSVLAIATAIGTSPASSIKTLQFGGYKWEIRETPGDSGGTRNVYDPTNASIDSKGFLHLRINRRQGQWMSSEVRLPVSLGYGSYRFVISDVSHLEPAVVLALGPPQEMDTEISRWGEPEHKNAQYVVQPYLAPANTVRFRLPAGVITNWLQWEPGRVAFKTCRGASSNMEDSCIAEHVFTSGIPSPGNERVHLNFYLYGNKRSPLQHDSEVVIEKFEFRP